VALVYRRESILSVQKDQFLVSPLAFVPAMPPVRNRYCDRRAEICVDSESCEMLIQTQNMFPSREPVYPCRRQKERQEMPQSRDSWKSPISRRGLLQRPVVYSSASSSSQCYLHQTQRIQVLSAEKSNLLVSTIVIPSPPEIISSSYSVCLLHALLERAISAN